MALALAYAPSCTTMVRLYDPKQQCLPSSAELPDSDDTPVNKGLQNDTSVDSELHNLVPNLLASSLALAWAARKDWFFGVQMGIDFAPREPAIVPDGFLSLGVDRFGAGEDGRFDYSLRIENNVVPCFVLEVLSLTYKSEYGDKKDRYVDMGIPYYGIYVPHYSRRDRDPLEVYELANGDYRRLQGEPVWLPEIGLGLGRARGVHRGWEREWLYWYDQAGNRLPTPEERAKQAEETAARLASKLRDLEIVPNEI